MKVLHMVYFHEKSWGNADLLPPNIYKSYALLDGVKIPVGVGERMLDDAMDRGEKAEAYCGNVIIDGKLCPTYRLREPEEADAE